MVSRSPRRRARACRRRTSSAPTTRVGRGRAPKLTAREPILTAPNTVTIPPTPPMPIPERLLTAPERLLTAPQLPLTAPDLLLTAEPPPARSQLKDTRPQRRTDVQMIKYFRHILMNFKYTYF